MAHIRKKGFTLGKREHSIYLSTCTHILYRKLYVGRYMLSKIAYLHGAKERETKVYLTRPVFKPFSLKVAWSGLPRIASYTLTVK